MSEINTLYRKRNKNLFYLCDKKKKILFGAFFVTISVNSPEIRNNNTDCWLGVSNRVGKQWLARMFWWWRTALERLVDHRLTRVSVLFLQRLRTHSLSDMEKTGFWCGVASLTLVRMLKRYFSLEHSSIASSKRAELGSCDVFKVSISAVTVWIRSSWKNNTIIF